MKPHFVKVTQMLLRRLMAQVRDQNWFAVGLDFVIVVIGVFIGIQVANWNDERLSRQEELILIERLRVDFSRIKDDADRSLSFHQWMAENLRTVVRSVRSGTLAEADVNAFEQALMFGISFQTSADHSGTFTELMSSGRARILRDRDLLDELVDYEDFLTRFGVAQQYYLDIVVDALPDFAASFSYETDMQFRQLLLATGWTPNAFVEGGLVTYDFDTLSEDPAFDNAAEQLLFAHLGYSMWRQRITVRVDALQRRLLDKESAD